jgi:hypothetical protein
MGSFFGAENYIFWQPMAARLSISLWQSYGTLLAAIYSYFLISLWQFYCNDHKCIICRLQSQFYDLKTAKCVEKSRPCGAENYGNDYYFYGTTCEMALLL